MVEYKTRALDTNGSGGGGGGLGVIMHEAFLTVTTPDGTAKKVLRIYFCFRHKLVLWIY